MTNEERHLKRYKNRQIKRKGRVIPEVLPFDEAFSFDKLNKAFYKCKKGVFWKESIQKYEAKLFSNNLALSKEVLTGKYKQRPFIEFDIMERGKLRHIRSVPTLKSLQLQTSFPARQKLSARDTALKAQSIIPATRSLLMQANVMQSAFVLTTQLTLNVLSMLLSTT